MSGVLGQGSTLKWNNVQITGVRKIGNIPLENPEVEVTDLDSVAKEFIAGLKDYGTVDIEAKYLPGDAGQIAMEADAKTGTVRQVKVYLKNLSVTSAFNAFVKSFKYGEASPDGVIPVMITLRITGDISKTAANLTDLTISEGTLTPVFGAAVYEYAAIAAFETTTCTVTPTLAGGVITVTANGVSQTVSTGVPSSAITLDADGIVDIVINATKDGGSSTYTIHVGVAAS
jgi:hypothetical protein